MEILANLDRILIKQKIELLEVITSVETNNRYAICNASGQPILTVKEDTGCCSRMLCRENRPFVFNFFDLRGVLQIRVVRGYTCNCVQFCNCSSCCRDSVYVECPPGIRVGSVTQNCTCCKVSFRVRDAYSEPLLHLQGPSYCLCTCPGTVHTFSVQTPDRSAEIGKLSKVWSGLVRELLTDADNFELLVPAHMPVQHKALLLGATLLIDFMFFEDNSGKGKKKRNFL